ncbi:MAG TPA: DUF402 domain-containing protein [Pyrinomonadaceae bacterium]|nr:DUF402 domain-containing protein [Pyrinomonadaceae bacterium]
MKRERSRIYTVNSRKFDGAIRRSWTCEFVFEDAEKIDLVGSFEHRVEHPDLGPIEAGTISRETFYFNRWYNFFIFKQPNGRFRNYYINICMPPEIGDATIDYVDLDIDLVVWPDGGWQTLDLEEFHENRLKFNYPDEVSNRVMETLKELEDIVQRGSRNDELIVIL